MASVGDYIGLLGAFLIKTTENLYGVFSLVNRISNIVLFLLIFIQVVHEIDRLTAGINLSEDAAPLAQEEATPSNPYSNHADELLPALPHAREDRIVLRTNSPSLVHTAAVVKTSLFNQANHSNGANHAPGMNGHPPQLHPASDSDPRPQCLDPKVIVWNGTSSPRTQKPPRYPQNGRCGKSPHSPPLPARTPWHPGSGRQNGSMV